MKNKIHPALKIQGLLVEILPQIVFLKDINSVYIACNKAYAEDLGIDKREITGKTDFDFFPDTHARKYQQDDERIMKLDNIETIEEEYIKQGQTFIIRTYKTPVWDEKGKVIGILGIIQDITNSAQTAKILKQYKADLAERIKELNCLNSISKITNSDFVSIDALFQNVLDTIPLGFKYPEYTCARIIYKDSSFITENFSETQFKLSVAISFNDSKAGSIDVFNTKPDILPKNAFLEEETELMNAVAALLGSAIKRQQHQVDLDTKMQEFMQIFNSFPEILYVTDPHTYEVIYVNKVFADMLGKDVTGEICYKAFQGLDSICPFCTNETLLQTNKPYCWEHHNQLLDKYFMITDQLIKWPDGREVRFEVAIDITDRKKAEKELHNYKEHLEKIVQDRTQKLELEVEEGKRRESIIARQTEAIMEMSTPVVKLLEGVIAAPLIGMFDSQRANQFMTVLLDTIVKMNAQVALIDITGVPAIDTQTAQNLIETVAAVRLLGCKVILTGISPKIAQTMVHIGITLTDIETCSSLSSGLIKAFKLLNIQMIPKDSGRKIK